MNLIRPIWLFGLICLSFFSCDTNETDGHFGIFLFDNEDSDFYLTTNTLSERNADTISGKLSNTDLGVFAYRNGFYYGYNEATGDLIKAGVEQGKLQIEKRLPLKPAVTWHPVASWHSWADDSTLLLGTSMAGKQFVYMTVNVNSMEVSRSGKLDIPLPEDGYNYGGVMGRLAGNKLYVAYMLYQYENRQALPGDTMYLATIDYPSMQTTSITTDTRSTFPGGYILFWQVSLELDGDIYFITQPGGRLRRHPDFKSAVFRIKKGDNKLDPGYFFPLSDNLTQEAYGLYDLGNGLAVTKIADRSKVNQFSDYYENNVISYHLLDLKQKTITKMPLPDDRLDFHKNLIEKNGKAFIGIYGPDGRSAVWSYDLKTGEVKRGFQTSGQILVIDQLAR